MNDILTKEKQQELFEEFSPSSPKRVERIPALAKSNNPILITTTTEQILLASIIGILILCAIFFLGVLRGKALKNSIMGEPAVSRRVYTPAPTVLAPTPQKTTSAQRVIASPALAAISRPPSNPATQAPDTTLLSKPYTIQLVTHRGRMTAEAEVMSLQKAGHISFIIPSGEYYQVCVGQYTSKEEAKKQLRAFSARFKDSFVRRR